MRLVVVLTSLALASGWAWAQTADEWAVRARRAEKESRLSEAESCWKQAVTKLQPGQADYAEACFYLGRLLAQQNRPQEADAWLRKANQAFERLKRWDGVALASLQLGLNELELEHRAEAGEHFQTSLEAARRAGDLRREMEALERLASWLDISHRWVEAEDAYRRLAAYQLQHAPESWPDTTLTLAALFQLQGKMSEASDAYLAVEHRYREQQRPELARQASARCAAMWLKADDFQRAEGIYAALLQEEPTSVVYQANRGHCLEQLGRPAEALQLYSRLLEQTLSPAHRDALERQWIRLSYQQGQRQQALQRLEASFQEKPAERAELLFHLGEREAALELLSRSCAEASSPEVRADLLNRRALLYFKQQQPEKAGQCLREALELPQLPARQQATLLTNLAESHLLQDQYTDCVPLLEKAVELWDRLKGNVELATALNNLSSAYQYQGRWDRALQLLRQAEEVGDAFQEPHPIQGTIANALGLLHVKMGRLGDGVAYYKKALALRLANRDLRGQMVTHANLAVVFAQQSLREPSLRQFEKALELSQRLQDRSMQATLANNLSAEFPDLPQAESGLLTALELSKSQGSSLTQAITLLNLARQRARKGDLQQARERSVESWQILQKLGAREEQFHVLAFFLGQGWMTPEGEDPGPLMMGLVEDQVQGLPSRLARAFVGSQRLALAALVERALRRQGSAAGLDLEERLRALGVLALTKESSGLQSRIPVALRQRRQALESRLREMLALPTSRSDLQGLKREYRLVSEEIERVSLAAGAIHRARAATTQELREALQPDELLVEFIELEGKRSVVLVGRDLLETVWLRPAQPHLETPLGLNWSPARKSEYLEGLGKALWEPWKGRVPATVRRLVLIPSGRLFRLPLAAMSLGGVSLIESHQVECSTSATSWLLSRRAPASGRGTLLAALGRWRPSPQLSPLPGTLQEIRRLQPLLPESRVLLEKEFTRRALEEQSRSCRHLHLATHGLLDGEEPLLGGLACSDGLVTVGDVFGWSLEAQLTVLSACNTGRFLDGQEYVALTRAFQCAGSRTLMVTLWPIADEATARWMELFYQALSRGKSLSEAHQAATLKARDELRDPYLWAPFVLWGDGRPPA